MSCDLAEISWKNVEGGTWPLLAYSKMREVRNKLNKELNLKIKLSLPGSSRLSIKKKLSQQRSNPGKNYKIHCYDLRKI